MDSMNLRTALGWLCQRDRRRKPCHIRLCLECLEDRTLPTTLLGPPSVNFAASIPYRDLSPMAGQQMELAVGDLDGNGRDDFVYGDEARDRVAVVFSNGLPDFIWDRTNGLSDPTAVALADLNG